MKKPLSSYEIVDKFMAASKALEKGGMCALEIKLEEPCPVHLSRLEPHTYKKTFDFCVTPGWTIKRAEENAYILLSSMETNTWLQFEYLPTCCKTIVARKFDEWPMPQDWEGVCYECGKDTRYSLQQPLTLFDPNLSKEITISQLITHYSINPDSPQKKYLEALLKKYQDDAQP